MRIIMRSAMGTMLSRGIANASPGSSVCVRHGSFLSTSLSNYISTSTTIHRTCIVGVWMRGLATHAPVKATAEAERPEVEAEFFMPRAKRSSPTDHYRFDSVFTDRLVRNNRSSTTDEINYTHVLWTRHKSPWRKLRHMGSILKSSALQRLIMPDLAIVGTVAIGVSYYNYTIAADAANQMGVHFGAMGGATTAIGILAAWRLNSSYGRFEEGRKFWGEINNTSRDLAGNACMWMETHELRDRMLKLIKSFAVVTNFHLNEKGGHKLLRRDDPDFQAKKYAEFYTEINDIYLDEKHEDFVNIVNMYKHGGHLPLSISSYMRALIAKNHELGCDPMYNREMDEQVQRMVLCLGQAERVLRTPLPTCFTRHTSRLFFLWANLLPFMMYDSLGPYGTLPGSLMVAWAVLGIADIGVQLEEPFSILPIRQYSDGIYDGVNAIEKAYDVADGYMKKHGAGVVTSSIIGGASPATK